MKKKSTKIWITLLVAPVLLMSFVFLFHWVFAEDATNKTDINDSLLNIGELITILGFFGSYALVLLYPVWIFMLIRATRYNKRLTKSK